MSPEALPDGDETEHFERKSLRKVAGRTADWDALAGDCVAFANAGGPAIDALNVAGEVLPGGKRRWTKCRLKGEGPKGHAP